MMIGHEKLIKDFKKLVSGGNLAHGYLFFGQPRVGKKLFASCLANFLETGKLLEPDKILTDFLLIKPDEKGTIGIDRMRHLRNFLWQKPFASPRRTAVINDSEAMTSEAQNAILKIAEEPPESSLLIIIASDYERLWPTLQSRLQKIYFAPVGQTLIEKWLKENAKCKVDDAKNFAEASFGQPGLALMLASDENFRLLRQSAENFLKSGFWERRNVIKAMLESEKFNLSRFLEALLILISRNAASGKNLDLWHKVSALRRDSESYNINPRLQLESLLSN
ncbi:MAG: hypothetical protein Q7K44_04990 [Candidatus Liptonbacteria bacterium]|nr:hypothetical protein [Candidatus Liptonbacteria bacterium]